MVHVTLESKLSLGLRQPRYSSYNLYRVVINGEEGESYEYEVEADSYAEASRLGQMRTHALGVVRADMEVGGQFVDEEQETHARKESDGGGHHRPRTPALYHFHCRNQERPHRCGHHDARCEAQQGLLQTHGHLVLHEEHKGRAENRSQQRNEESYGQCCCHRLQRYKKNPKARSSCLGI